MLYRLRDKTRKPLDSGDITRPFPIRFIEEVSSAPTREELLSVVARWLAHLFPAHRSSLTLRHDEEHLSVVVFNGDDAIPVSSLLPIAGSAAGQAVARREIWLVSDMSVDDPSLVDLQMLRDSGINSGISVPLIMSGKCFGCLNLGHHDKNAYDDIDARWIQALAFWIASQLNHYENLGTISQAMQRERVNLAMLDQLAKYDSLTGLLNRREFLAQLAVRLAAGEDAANGEIVLLYLDLDGFKAINDTFGHGAGDALLKMTAERLTEALQPGDLAARLGGDEFAIAIGPIAADGEAAARQLGTELIASIARPYQIDGQTAFVATSVGIKVARVGQAEPEAALRDADLALYQVKQHGGSNPCFFDEAVGAEVRLRAEFAKELQFAIERHELELHYQPIHDAKDHRIVACEAMVRWCHPVHGIVPPGQFIPIAESSTLISLLGAWILRDACKEAVSWSPEVSVAINVSPRQFAIGDIVGQVSAALKESGLDPTRLQLEITEAVILDAPPERAEVLEALSAMGVQIVLDNFGAGFASLRCLKQFKFRKIKIDRSFVEILDRDERTLAIVQAILRLAETLSIGTAAKGVETRAQRDHLRDLGFDELQGFLFSRPQSGPSLRKSFARFRNKGERLARAERAKVSRSKVA